MTDEPEANGKDDKYSELQLKSALILPNEALPTTLHIIPISGTPFFPAQVMPILLTEEPWLETIEKIGENPHHILGLMLVKSDNADLAKPEDFYEVGSVVRMHNPMRKDGRIQFVAEGLERIRIVRWISDKPPYVAEVEYPKDVEQESDELKAYALAIINSIKELLPLNPLYSEELKAFLNRFSPNDPSPLSDFAASMTTAGPQALQDVLETIPVMRRMEKVLVLIKKELEVAKLQANIRERVEEKLSNQQREFFLREQLKEIQKELGISKDDKTAEMEQFTQRLKDLTLPEDAQKRIDEELQKFSVLETGSPEYAVTRNYLDWITAIPWGRYSEDKLDLDASRAILDEDHDGLEDVKDRIIEFLALGVFRGEISGAIVLFVGPPGVGKTSIGHSIAKALGRKFYRFSVGGMRDEAEIKGHRRTYIGALPGKLVQALKDTGTANPVIMLDEVDKIGASYQGDPASALLEVLDPEQNNAFLDHYLDVRLDLSKVLFVCTANQLDTIPSPLLDRMEIIRLSGYITSEKVLIAKHHLWPKLLEHAGAQRKIKITDGALRHLIEGYAREAGVRGLNKRLGRIIRKAVVEILQGHKPPVRIGIKELEHYLGPAIFRADKLPRGIGIVTGLAWTPLGGATLIIEATLVHSKNRGFKLTGQLGDVMSESAQIAYSYICANLGAYQGDPDFFDQAFVHLHVPEGATPKDGPSAGITMATALLSLARKQKIKRALAMTGELTLTGLVLPVGGIREKVIAARRSRIKELIFCTANQRDYEELPEHITEGITVYFVDHFKEVAEIVFD